MPARVQARAARRPMPRLILTGERAIFAPPTGGQTKRPTPGPTLSVHFQSPISLPGNRLGQRGIPPFPGEASAPSPPRRRMRSNLFANILQSIRGRGHQDSLKSLKKAGYERLTVLTVRDLDEAIARAVDSTLKEYGIALEEGALRGLTGEAQTAFLKLVQERNELREVNEALEREKKDPPKSFLRWNVD